MRRIKMYLSDVDFSVDQNFEKVGLHSDGTPITILTNRIIKLSGIQCNEKDRDKKWSFILRELSNGKARER